MAITTYEGKVENRRIKRLGAQRLPEHAPVHVVVPEITTTRPRRVGSPRLVNPEEAKMFKKRIIRKNS